MGKKKGGGGKKDGGQKPPEPPQQQQQQPRQQQPQQQPRPQQQQQQQPPAPQPQAPPPAQDFPSLGGGGGGGGGGGPWNRGGGKGGGRGQGPHQQQQGQGPPQQSQSDRGRGGGGPGRGGYGRGEAAPQGQGPPQQSQSDRGRGGGGPGRGGYGRGEAAPQGQGPPQQSQSDRGRGGGGPGRGGYGQGDEAPQGQGPPQQSKSDRGRGGGGPGHGGNGRGDEAPQGYHQQHQSDRGRGGRGGGGGGRGRGAPPPGMDHPQQGSRGVEPQRQISPPQPQPSVPPPSSQSQAQLATSMSTLQVSSTKSSTKISSNGKKSLWTIPERKKKCDGKGMVGTRGRVIPIEVNHLLLTLKKTGIAYHYDCDFKPDVPKKLFRRAMDEMRKKYYPQRWPAFDGRKNLYSSGELPFNGQVRDTVQVKDDERDKPKEFDVTIKLVSNVDMSQVSAYLNNGVGFPQDAIQALDIVLRNPSAMKFTPVGRSFFTRPTNEIIKLGDGLELWYGFYQSAVLGWRPFLNVDVAHKGFPEPKSLLDVMLDMMAKNCRYNDPRPTIQDLARQGLQRWELEDFGKFIRGLKVMYELPNQPNTRRVYKINGIKEPCISQRFKLDDGRTITIGEYYEREKKYRLKFPKLNSIHVGSMAKDVCVPPELCTIIQGQVVNKKLNENQTAAMVKAAARPADERKQRIMNAMRQAGFNQDPCINEFGVTVSQEFQKVNARVLNPPALEYAGKQMIRARAGVWRAGQFLSTNRLERWVVMTLSGRGNEAQLRDFAKTMAQQGRSLGMNIAEPYRYTVVCNEAQNLRNANGMTLQRIIQPYFEQYKKELAQLVVVVIPDRPPDSYSKVKLTAEVNVGLLTQCLKEKTMFKMNPATAGNILLKLNAKLNGVNHTVDRSFCPSIMDAPTILLGADVTHPSPDQTNIPSVAAVAASHDRRAFQYNMVWRLQPPREEIILDLATIMREQLLFFFKKTGQKPLRVLFYRDGVSEGQFSQVLEREMSAIRKACASLQADYQPKVTFLVVQKRHHTRFFPTRKEDEDGRNKNVPAGTIVDTMITHPKEMDFYLVSHASLQGTSRPTKYHKLWDENDIDEDDLEELTFYLCHMFSRCTRSVSYPAPTYYAHLAAFRGRVYLEGSTINLTNLNQEMHLRQIKENVLKDFPMFFV